MKKLLLCFVFSLLSAQTVFAQSYGSGRPDPYPGSPSNPQTEEERQREEGRRRDELARYERAMNAQTKLVVSALGRDSYDCLNNAQNKAYGESYNVIRQCESATEGLTTCEVASQRTLEYPRSVETLVSVVKYDERKSDESTCRTSAIARAEADALSKCRSKFGISCLLSSAGQVTDYHTETRRRYLIFGPNDLHQVCKAIASAQPPSEYTVQCSVEIVAKARQIRPRF